MVIVDTSVLIDFINGVTNPETQWLDFRLEHQRFALTTLILTEVLMGMRYEREAAIIEAELRHFELIELHERDLAIDAARNYRSLRTKGSTIRKMTHLLIATHCIRHHHSLLHRDRDFDVFEERIGLKVVHP
ncbi:MAG TPA: PIN domain-containing protein [Vicinamibacterales bacterium]|nr:PIN domain-containing protein [Vicinamibacterales bacterium]